MIFSDSYPIDFSQRDDAGKEDPLFVRRWSPRSFREETIPPDILESIFGAARWTQSCFNEQPWLFITESGPEDREVFRNLLLPGNRQWALDASLTGFIFARKNFSRNGKTNRWAAFDSGSAWMAMTLQARMYGLYTHGMAGIRKDEAYETLRVSPDEYEVMCGFVIGAIGKRERLDGDLLSREVPSGRKELSEIWIRGIKPE